ncbi:MAG: ABC transporter permease subunit [Proteobacteria bacterium]|nr:ABC transporter permease subunit [Pseudomonadota bacterium]
MSALGTVFRREWSSYLATPVAYVFTVIFLMLAAALPYYLGNFYERGQADLLPFFVFHPWLYLFIVPALAMRLWAEERASGTIELLLTLPLPTSQVVLGKFLAAWCYLGVALLLTFPMWLTVDYLGHPDNGVILGGYLGSWLMAGAFLAVGECLSAATRNQVVAYILTAAVCFVFLLMGYPLVQEAARGLLGYRIADAIAQLSFLAHFDKISRGLLDLRDIAYFVMAIAAWLLSCVWVVERGKPN